MSRDINEFTPEELEAFLGPEPKRFTPLTPGRALFRRSRGMNIKPRKHSPERMQRLIDCLREMPVAGEACRRAGISYSTMKYWYLKSTEGVPGDGFDMPSADGIDEETGDQYVERFHTAWDNAMNEGIAKVEVATHTRATGYQEVLTYMGSVVYRHDLELVAMLGGYGVDTYMRDDKGFLVPETVMKQDPDLMMFLLKTRKREEYGNHQTVDLNVRGGVLVVGAVAATPQTVDQLGDYKADAIDVDFEETEDDT